MTDPYQNLANEIVLSAVKDYRRVLKKLKHYPKNEDALQEKASCERFFRSSWFGMLTSIGPEMLIKKLQQEEK
ncbi:hypothetical protein NHG23_02485 [Aerococcaceae bacterium NML190073]|nr:hypothetical protein [Aerococcaceae bacterium NML190073]